MPKAAECDSCAKCDHIGSADTEVNGTGLKGVGDGQCS
jgi:hypothetical protein